MRKQLRLFLLVSTLISLSIAADIYAMSPPQLVSLFKNPINGHLSPIGYRPLTGRLQGLVMLADPIGACSKLTNLNNQNQEIFILADDTQCLESIKAKNIANSGGYVGLIKQNINNTLHDKEIKLVHIPIIELKPADFDALAQFVKKNAEKRTAVSIDFSDKNQDRLINVQFWFSPTQKESYEFLLDNKDFLLRQDQYVSFAPHYVLQSQRQTKNYIGCLSSGKYCPTQIEYQGKYEGKNIVEQTLRQIIIWDLSSEDWWKYINYFYKNCILATDQIFKNSTKLNYCSENAEIMAGINRTQLKRQYNASFLGHRKEVDDNTYLLEQRQLYIREQIDSHPAVLINKKMIEVDSQVVKARICKMQGENPTQDCINKKSGLSTNQILIILLVIISVFVLIAVIYRLYIHLRMKREIKSEVDKTLEQYYRYIQTFQGQNGQIGSHKKGKSKEKFKKLNEQMEEVADEANTAGREEPLKEIEMQKVNS